MQRRLVEDQLDPCAEQWGHAGWFPDEVGESGIERAADVPRLGSIGGGTDETMREILGDDLGR